MRISGTGTKMLSPFASARRHTPSQSTVLSEIGMRKPLEPHCCRYRYSSEHSLLFDIHDPSPATGTADQLRKYTANRHVGGCRDAITNLDGSGLVVMMKSFGFCAAIPAQESHHTGQLPPPVVKNLEFFHSAELPIDNALDLASAGIILWCTRRKRGIHKSYRSSTMLE